jgi:two-component system response regulator HydG
LFEVIDGLQEEWGINGHSGIFWILKGYESSDRMKPGKTRILIVDDDLDIQDLLESYFKPRGFLLEAHSEPTAPLRKLQKNPDLYDLIVTDLKMPEMDGMEFVRQVKKIAPKMPIILMTAHGTVKTAVEAIQAGAYDFVVKPVNCAQLTLSIERGLRVKELEEQNETLRHEVRSNWSFDGVIGKSRAIQTVFDLAKRVSKSSANVLITGESGTGKEVIARAIHHQGGRSQGPFVAINCSAIPDNLLESELFGHAKGAFTGAVEKRLGLFEEAEGGVLFLDEIGDMNLSLQAKLLRVLQERKIKRIGENQTRPINVRVIAATHKNLKQEIDLKNFREDLYYRLCVIPIQIPPLRERPEDILPLTQHFFEKFKAQNEASITGFTKSALDRLIHMKWRGNVRELENIVERAVVLCQGSMIDVADLPEPESELAPREAGLNPDELFSRMTTEGGELPSLEEFSQRYVAFVLNSAGGVKEKAAGILKIDRKTLYRRSLELKSDETGRSPAPAASRQLENAF